MDRTGFVEYRSLKLLQQSHYHLRLQFYTEVKLENVRNCLTQELYFDRRKLGGCFLICSDEQIYTSEESAVRDQNGGGAEVEAGIGIRDAFFPEKGFVNKAKPM